MDQRVGLFILLAAGLLCLSLVPICRAHDEIEDIGGEDVDVDVEDELEEDAQDEAPTTPQAPPTPKVRLRVADSFSTVYKASLRISHDVPVTD